MKTLHITAAFGVVACLASRILVFCLFVWFALSPARASLTDDDSITFDWNAYKAGEGAMDAALGSLELSTMPIATQGVTRTVRVIAKSAYPGASLFQGEEAVFLTVHDLEILSSGATTSFQLGFTPDSANANIYSRANAFYFAQNGVANASLTLRNNGVATTLWNTTNTSLLGARYSQVGIQFTRTTWVLTLYDASGAVLVSEAGNLPAPLDSGWAGGLHAHLAMNQSGNNGGYTTLLLDGLDMGRTNTTLLPLSGEQVTLPASCAFTEDFMTLGSWNAHKSGAGAVDPSVGGLELATNPITTQGVTRTVRVVTKSAYSTARLLQGEETICLNLHDLAILSSGATTSFQLGFTPDSTNANIYTRANAFYFAQNGVAGASLTLRNNGSSATLWSSADASQLGVHYSRASFWLGRTTWALVLYDAAGTALVNEAGKLPVLLGSGWANGVHAHFTMNQSGNNGGYTTLLVDSLDIGRKDTSTLFPLSGEQTNLRLDAPVGASSVTYKIRDYAAQVIGQGTETVDAEGKIMVGLTPPVGFYEIIFGDDDASATGFWSMPEARQKPSQDPFFSTDAAISLAPWDKRAGRMEPLSRLVSGNGLARERFSWSAINPAESEWTWDASQFETLRRTYRDAGIKILDVLHNAPTRLGGDPTHYGAFPLDMIGTYDACRTIAGRWHEIWGGLEVWNEPDIPKQSGDQPFDKYVALLKAVRLALHDEGVQTPIGSGVLAQFRREYIEHAIRNGMLENSDFVSFHYYGDPLRLEELISQWRDMLTWHGHSSKPLWITEAGIYADGIKNVRISVGEQARVARFVTMQAVEAKACGIARHFPFLISDYTEKEVRRFGFLDPKGTPLRAFAALAEVSRRLDGHDYIGDISIAAFPGIKRIRVFAPPSGSDQAVVVFYTGDENVAIDVTLPVYAESASGIDGRPLPVVRTNGSSSSSITVADGLAYMNVAQSALQDLIEINTGTMALYQLGKAPALPPPAPCPIIMQAHLDPAQVEIFSIRGYYISEQTNTLNISVWLNNLSSTTQQATISSPSIVTPVSVTIPPRSRQDLSLIVNVASLVDTVPAGDRRWLTLTGQTGEGAAISPVTLSIVVANNLGIADRLVDYAYRFELALAEGYRWERDGWQQDANGILTFNHSQVPWSYDVIFNPGDNKWAYPRYLLPQEVDLSRATGVLFRGRCQNPATVRLMAWDAQGSNSFTNNEIILPADNEWHVVYVPFYSFIAVNADGTPQPGQLKRFSVGMNSESDVNRIEISEIYLVGE